MRLPFVLVSCAAAALGGCAQSYGGLAPGANAVSVQQALPAPDPMELASALETYRIGPFDRLSIDVFGVEALSREVTVDSAGTVALPLVGQLAAAGKTPMELGKTIADSLRGRYVRDPQVAIGVKEVRSQKFTVDGAVVVPGVYPLVGRVSLVQAIASARGPTEYAELDKVAVFRTINRQKMAAAFSLKDIREGRFEDPQIYPNDIVVVGESGSRRTYRDLLQALPILGVFTPVLR